MDQVIAYSNLLIEVLRSLYMYSPVFGVLIGVYITYKLMTDKDRIMAASDAYINCIWLSFNKIIHY